MTTQPIMPSVVPEGSVIITPSQMYAEIRAMHGSIERLTTTVDPALTDIRSDIRDHETRLRGVERRIWQASGIVLLISTGGAALVTKLMGA